MKPATKKPKRRIDWQRDDIPIVVIVRQPLARCDHCSAELKLERSRRHDGYSQGRAVCGQCGEPNIIIIEDDC